MVQYQTVRNFNTTLYLVPKHLQSFQVGTLLHGFLLSCTEPKPLVLSNLVLNWILVNPKPIHRLPKPIHSTFSFPQGNKASIYSTKAQLDRTKASLYTTKDSCRTKFGAHLRSFLVPKDFVQTLRLYNLPNWVPSKMAMLVHSTRSLKILPKLIVFGTF